MVGHKGKDDDRPGVPFTRIQPRVVRNHDRGFPRPHQPSPSTSGYGADHSLVPAPARAFDGSPNGSPGGTTANGVASSPEPRVPPEIEPDFDTLSTDTADSLREQVRRVHQQLDEVQKEVLKSRGEVGESSKGGSPFTPEIQAKSLSATFRLPALEPYDGSGDPTEHIAAFRAQMTLYDTSDALMYRAFLTTLRGLAGIWYSCLKPASIPSFDLLEKEFELNFFDECTPKTDHCLPLGDGRRERRTPLPVRGAVHIASTGNS
ncbi:hypothetical protein B296_00049043 [Ensete ventricosum]|uniref:Retrotransposon gag domain-containing protein n=1 Tax=Ensete ventricosum TaxID=4639 RepID=A0A426YJM8_ENSVE|nr:hypothetical protein B296_00049043 [Ensete ventricosum]